MYGPSVPDDAQPGDLVIGNRGAAAEVQTGLGVLWLCYVGNAFQDGSLREGRRMVYDRS
jgi:hypothetical protein